MPKKIETVSPEQRQKARDQKRKRRNQLYNERMENPALYAIVRLQRCGNRGDCNDPVSQESEGKYRQGIIDSLTPENKQIVIEWLMTGAPYVDPTYVK